jgi:hypothetical protein
MPKHIINWKPIRSKNVRGSDYDCRIPETLDLIYRGTLLSEIVAMEQKKPMAFANAVNRAKKQWWEKFGSGCGDDADWIYDNFVEWISDQGYHIELTGDEFEPRVLAKLVS